MADQSIKDLAYRTAASVFGGPVDLATMVMRPFGYKTPDTQVFGSSEYIGKKMEDVGLVSSARSPLTEFLSSIAVPSPATVAKGLSLGAAKSLAMFVGPISLTWDSLAAGKAKTMEKMGTDARTIWKETGTWKGPDGKWRQEIDDSGSMFRGFGNVDSKSVGEVVHHPKAMAAYPEMAEMRAQSVPGTGGSFVGEMGYAPSSPTVNLGRDNESGTSVSLHELQHAVQGREGFARGGSVSGMAMDAAQDKYRANEIAQKLTRFQNEASDAAQLAKPDTIAKAEAWAKTQGDWYTEGTQTADRVKDYLLDQDRIYKSLYKEHADRKSVV